MVWRLETQQGKGRDFVSEGNVPVYLISREPTRAHFLVKTLDVKEYEKKGMTKEAIDDLLYAELMWQDWYVPVSMWEHTVIINGKFSTSFCIGANCELCKENQQARSNGIDENRLLPYPVRRRYVLPAWFYKLEKVLFVKQTADFFREVDKYIAKFGQCDFEIYKEGQGMGTIYKVTYSGQSETPKIEEEFSKPSEIDFTPVEQKDFRDFAEDKVAEGGEFKITFGAHNGSTLSEIWNEGDKEFIQFLVEKSDGEVQKQAKAFMDSK